MPPVPRKPLLRAPGFRANALNRQPEPRRVIRYHEVHSLAIRRTIRYSWGRDVRIGPDRRAGGLWFEPNPGPPIERKPRSSSQAGFCLEWRAQERFERRVATRWLRSLRKPADAVLGRQLVDGRAHQRQLHARTTHRPSVGFEIAAKQLQRDSEPFAILFDRES